MSETGVVVIDLDGTLANLDHRLPFVKQEKPDWDAFYAACTHDTINAWCYHLIRALVGNGNAVKIVSARSKQVEDKTKAWLKAQYIPEAVELIMLREEGDYTPDDDLKMKWLSQQNKAEILFVVDDRQRVVDMWRKEGLVCLQCYAWSEWKPKKVSQ